MATDTRTCFVIMPFGNKPDADGTLIDFDEIYTELIQEPLEALGIEYVRSDDIERPGLIHQDMFERIANADVAIVDITTLNANVFYELGARHALRPGVTVLIRRRGSTGAPFNIEGLRIIEYPSKDGRLSETRKEIRRFIEAGLRNDQPDSPIFALARQRVEPDKGERIRKLQKRPYALRQNPGKRITVITGDIQDHRGIDVWVNSENTNMQMARPYDPGMSAIIRYLGARKDGGRIVEDTIAKELETIMGGRDAVPPGTVYATTSGALSENGVKQIFHAAAVAGMPGAGYRQVPDVDRCVTASLRLADSDAMRPHALTSIVFPLFGTGSGKGDLRQTAERLIQAAISYLVTNPASTIDTVYFSAWNQRDLEACLAALDASDEVARN